MERIDSYLCSSEDLRLQSLQWEIPCRSLSLSPVVSQPQKPWEPIRLCGTLPTTVVPAERHVEQLWAALDQTLQHSKCGVESDTPVGQGETLDMKTFTIVGAPAPVKKANPYPNELSYPASGVPPPPEYLPEMKDAVIVKHTTQAPSPRS